MAMLKRTIEGYVFWTVFSALPPMIWFYPMNKLDLTGYEAFVVVLFSPILLKVEFLSRILRKRNFGPQFIESMMVLSLLSFQMPTTFSRLCVVAFGAFWAAIKMAIDYSSTEDGERNEITMGYTIGYVALLTSRIFYKTITPAFNDYFSNWAIFAACATNILLSSAPSDDKDTPKKRPPLKCNMRQCYLGAAAGFGSLLYLKLSVFGEMSVPFRWFVDSKQLHSTTLDSNPYSLIILACLICGYFIGYKFQTVVIHPLWSLTGLLAFAGLYKLSNHEGLLSACVLAVFVGSLWSIYSTSFFECCRPPVVFMIAMLFYLMPAFYAVWTVAYNFVPLGTYAREFTGLSIGWLMFFISMDMFVRWRRQYIVSFDEKSRQKSGWLVIFLLFLLSCGGMYTRCSKWTKSDRLNDVDHVTAMIWTYHFGYDNDGWPSLERTAKLIKDIDADVIGLLETDSSRLYMGNNDLAQWLAETLNMYVDYGPATKKHTWGCIVLSKFPILSSEHYLLPSPHGELAPALSATLDVGPSRNLTVIVTHMGNDRDDLDRKLQAEYLSDLSASLSTNGSGVIFLGYVTSKPFDRDYRTFTSRGKLKDIDSSDRDRFCEYIFYQNLKRLSYARISKGRLSDTEIQAAKFDLESSGSDDNDVTLGANEISDPNVISNKALFPARFGDFYRGHYHGNDHRYHMSTPKYFTRNVV